MKLARAQQIAEAWGSIDDGEMSLEMLFARVCDHFRNNINNGGVAQALRMVKEHEDAKYGATEES